jgi:hypothetical protein
MDVPVQAAWVICVETGKSRRYEYYDLLGRAAVWFGRSLLTYVSSILVVE